jgi:hypothetical protein
LLKKKQEDKYLLYDKKNSPIGPSLSSLIVTGFLYDKLEARKNPSYGNFILVSNYDENANWKIPAAVFTRVIALCVL